LEILGGLGVHSSEIQPRLSMLLSECIDWAAIHQREFDKMDSLDVYVKKREARQRRLKTPVKRAASFAAKLARGPPQQDTNTAKVSMQEARLRNALSLLVWMA